VRGIANRLDSELVISRFHREHQRRDFLKAMRRIIKAPECIVEVEVASMESTRPRASSGSCKGVVENVKEPET
jgi:hypothetical protein